MVRVNDSGFILASQLNSFHYLWQDADMLLHLARDPVHANSYRRSQLARSAALLYVIAFEALMNMGLAKFLSREDSEDILSGERNMSTLDKLDALLGRAPNCTAPVDKSRYPWSHLREVVSMRNDYVHPKFGRPSFLEIFAGPKLINLLPERIPHGLRWQPEGACQPEAVSRKSVVYDQTGLPRDPTSFMIEDAESVRKIIDDNIRNIDALLSGAFSRDRWIESDSFKLIYPPGKNLNDPLPPYPPELSARFGE